MNEFETSFILSGTHYVMSNMTNNSKKKPKSRKLQLLEINKD